MPLGLVGDEESVAPQLVDHRVGGRHSVEFHFPRGVVGPGRGVLLQSWGSRKSDVK